MDSPPLGLCLELWSTWDRDVHLVGSLLLWPEVTVPPSVTTAAAVHCIPGPCHLSCGLEVCLFSCMFPPLCCDPTEGSAGHAVGVQCLLRCSQDQRPPLCPGPLCPGPGVAVILLLSDPRALPFLVSRQLLRMTRGPHGNQTQIKIVPVSGGQYKD